jgi:hypothetical protein
LRGTYRPTAKNGIVKDHYLKLGFTQQGQSNEGASLWSLKLAEFVAADVPIETRVAPAVTPDSKRKAGADAHAT